MQSWIDEHTGRQVRQLTAYTEGASVPYFRLPRNFPDGRVMVYGKHDSGNLAALDSETGDIQFIADGRGSMVRWRESDGCAWYYDKDTREVLQRIVPDGDSRVVGHLDPSVAGDVHDITCDWRTLIGANCECEPSEIAGIFSDDYRGLWRWIYRQRSAVMWSYDLVENRYTEILQMLGYNPTHVDASPVDPTLIKFALDGVAIFDQRIHAMRIDGTEWRQIRPQQPGEWVHHEFWWPGAQQIGYKYLDRRGDATVHLQPWGEYAPHPLHLGIANLAGEEIYCSDPLDHYQSHLNVSPDARFVTGEGTHNHSFVSVAAFDMASTRIDFQPMATIHTQYVPSAAQGVETCVTQDARWVVFNDTVEGTRQVCAVELVL
jgi:hypothetical protein